MVQKAQIEVWLSLVERYVRDVEVASSNLVTSTKKEKKYRKVLLFLFLLKFTDSSFSNAEHLNALRCTGKGLSQAFGAKLSSESCHLDQKRKGRGLGAYSKGQFSEIRYISKGVCRVFAFVNTNAVLVKKNRWTFGGQKKTPLCKRSLFT